MALTKPRGGVPRDLLPALLLQCLIALQITVHGHYPEALDVVTMAIKPTCVNRQMVTSLNKFLVPKPRKIHIIASTNCQGFRAFAPNVACHLEDKLVPGITRELTAQWLEERFNNRHGRDRERVVKRSNWFFQQLVKLAASEYLPDLTQHFLVFDSDMIALRPLTWFISLDHPRVEKATGLADTSGRRRRMVESSEQDGNCVNPHPFRTLIHVGGWLPRYGYMKTYQNLTGVPILRGHDGASLVTHNMLVYRPFMAQFLGNITTGHYKDNKIGWALAVLDAVSTLPDVGEVIVGFSEFWSYLSWVQQRYPCTVIQAKRPEWTRSPALHPSALPIAVLHQGAFLSICCPTARNLDVTRQRGFLFTGYELGHLRHCQYHHAAFRDGYAPWYFPL